MEVLGARERKEVGAIYSITSPCLRSVPFGNGPSIADGGQQVGPFLP